MVLEAKSDGCQIYASKYETSHALNIWNPERNFNRALRLPKLPVIKMCRRWRNLDHQLLAFPVSKLPIQPNIQSNCHIYIWFHETFRIWAKETYLLIDCGRVMLFLFRQWFSLLNWELTMTNRVWRFKFIYWTFTFKTSNVNNLKTSESKDAKQ